MAIDSARGLAYLHRKRIAWLDCKASNVLLTKCGPYQSPNMPPCSVLLLGQECREHYILVGSLFYLNGVIRTMVMQLVNKLSNEMDGE